MERSQVLEAHVEAQWLIYLGYTGQWDAQSNDALYYYLPRYRVWVTSHQLATVAKYVSAGWTPEQAIPEIVGAQ